MSYLNCPLNVLSFWCYFAQIQPISQKFNSCLTDGRTDGRTDRRMDGRTDGWTNGQMDGHSLIEMLGRIEKEKENLLLAETCVWQMDWPMDTRMHLNTSWFLILNKANHILPISICVTRFLGSPARCSWYRMKTFATTKTCDASLADSSIWQKK